MAITTKGITAPSGVQSSSDVKRMQAELNSKGATLKVDGVWGPKSQAAYNALSTSSSTPSSSASLPSSTTGAASSAYRTGSSPTVYTTTGIIGQGGYQAYQAPKTSTPASTAYKPTTPAAATKAASAFGGMGLSSLTGLSGVTSAALKSATSQINARISATQNRNVMKSMTNVHYGPGEIEPNTARGYGGYEPPSYITTDENVRIMQKALGVKQDGRRNRKAASGRFSRRRAMLETA